MKQSIYLSKFKMTEPVPQIQNKILSLLNSTSLKEKISQGDITAVKVHFGEYGNNTFVPADLIKPLVDLVKQQGGKPFVSDTNVLYKSQRDNAVDHLLLAEEHGFSLQSLGAPLIIADGISGRNETSIKINAPLNESIHLATEFVTCNSIIVATHATGHLLSGLGATIKNLGMGMASRKGKLIQHSVSKPRISKKDCTNCGQCAAWCPVNAIEKKSTYFNIMESTCIGCGECLAVCRYNAVKFNWDSGSELLQKQMAEHALGIVTQKRDKIIYTCFLINMTKDCDCLKQPKNFVHPDIGILVGEDPVAIDQAVLDLTETSGNNLSKTSYPQLNPEIQLDYGEKIGLGSRKYKLIET